MAKYWEAGHVTNYPDFTSKDKEAEIFLERSQETDDADCLLIRQMDKEAVNVLLRLSSEIESFTLKELKGLYRRSRVAIETGLTNNRHIHEQIIKLLEENIVVDTHKDRHTQLDEARRVAMKRFKGALEQCCVVQAKLSEIEEQKAETEERYMDAVLELSQADMEKRQILAGYENERLGSRHRKRTSSM